MPGRSCQPAQCRSFIAAPEPEVEHDADAYPQGLQGHRDEQPFQYVAFAIGLRPVEQRDHPLIRGQPQCPVRQGKLFGAGRLPGPGEPDHEEQRGGGRGRLGRRPLCCGWNRFD